MFYSNKPSPNSWDYAFEAENGIKQSATGEMKLVGEEEVVVMRGSYEYIGADGLTYVVDWEADENGFRAAAPHLPKGPSTYYVITFKGEGRVSSGSGNCVIISRVKRLTGWIETWFS